MWVFIFYFCTFTRSWSRRSEWKTPQARLLSYSPIYSPSCTPIPGPPGLGNFLPAGERIRSQPDSKKCGLGVAAGKGLVRQLQGPLAGEAWIGAGDWGLGARPQADSLGLSGLGWLFSPPGSRPVLAGLDSDNNPNDPYLPGTGDVAVSVCPVVGAVTHVSSLPRKMALGGAFMSS